MIDNAQRRDGQDVVRSALQAMTRGELSAAQRATGVSLSLFLADIEPLPDWALRRLAFHLWSGRREFTETLQLRERRKLGGRRS
jgi:hypothetical protein